MTDVDDGTVAYPATRDLSCPYEPAPEYKRLLAEHPVSKVRLWNGTDAWLVTKHRDGQAVLEHKLVSAEPTRPGYPHVSASLAGYRKSGLDTFNNKDNPQHNMERRMFTRWFTVKNIEAMRPALQRIVDDDLDRFARLPQPADFVEHVALSIPSKAIFALLDAPYDDHAFVAETTNTMLSWRSTTEQAQAASAQLRDYCFDLIEQRRKHPGSDVVSVAIEQYVATGSCTYEQLAEGTRLLFLAGHETTANQISLGTLALLDHPEAKQLVQSTDDPAVIANVVDELLRYITVAQAGRCRAALEDIEIGGQPIRAGEGIIVSSEAANRDPEVFADPERFDVHRSNADKHAAFGHGTHRCLGETLAEVELQVVFGTLFKRLPNLQVAVPRDEIEYKTDHTLYGLYRLPMTW